MVFKGCQRCSGDMRIEEDISTRFDELVCIQCGHRQAMQPAFVHLNAREETAVTNGLAARRRSKSTV